MKIFLHIGAGKCASSSIQNFFSFNNVISDFGYVALLNNGKILDSTSVKNKAESSPTNYAASSNFENGIDFSFVSTFKSEIDRLSKSYNKILLSSEGWGAHARSLDQLMSCLQGHDVEVIYIVRPPVLWVNSAWWQWQQWEDTPDVDKWVKTSNVAHQWFDTFSEFDSLASVSCTHLLSLQKNILKQVADIIGIDVDLTEGVHNSASSSELLNFFRANRSLRKEPHDSGGEFILNKYLKQRSGVDWVLSEENVNTILSNSKKFCEKLAVYISNEDIALNRLWWDLDEYRGKIDSLNRDNIPSYDDLSSMLEEAYHVIINLDDKIRNA